MFLLLSLLVCLSGSVLAQRELHHQTLYWIRYQSQISLNPQCYINAEMDNRRFFGPDVQHQFIIHTRFHYKIASWDFGGGLTSSWAYALFPENGNVRRPVMEVRPVMEASHEWITGLSAFQNRIRFDHRFIEDDPEQSVFGSNEYIPRLRHRLQWKKPLLNRPDGGMLLNVRISNEIMINLRKNTFDQNRIYASGDLFITGRLSIEAGFIHIYQQRLGRKDVFFLRNVVRFSVIQKF